MTEEQARKKWCPMTRFLYAEGDSSRGVYAVAVNTDRPESLCVGSECMMWRWDEKEEEAHGLDGTECGYCGLAGARPR
jgi:hypothetical protein